MKNLIVGCLLVLMIDPALAVYKCEADGKVSYGDSACADGKKLPFSPETDAASASMAQKRLMSDKKEAERLSAIRHKEEAIQEKQAAKYRRIAASQQKKCLLMEQRLKWAEEDASKATGSSAEKSRRKAKRANEKYQLECK